MSVKGNTFMVKTSEYTRTWKYDDKASYTGIIFFLEYKPDEKFFLVKDKNINHCYNIHFLTHNQLSESEKEMLVMAVIDYLKPGEFLATCGYYTHGGVSEYNRFYYRTKYFKTTSCIRTLINKADAGEIRTFPILQKI